MTPEQVIDMYEREMAHKAQENKQLRADLEKAQKWREAVDQKLTNWHMVATDDPLASLQRLIQIETETALDPCVSAEAQRLRDTYKADLDTERELKQALESYVAAIPGMCAGNFSQPCALHVREPIENLWNQLSASKAERDALAAREKRLREALEKVKQNICRDVPDDYSQPCVDECAQKCDAIIDTALARESQTGGEPLPDLRIIEVSDNRSGGTLTFCPGSVVGDPHFPLHVNARPAAGRLGFVVRLNENQVRRLFNLSIKSQTGGEEKR